MSSQKPSQQAFIRNFHCLSNIQILTHLSRFPLKKKKKKESEIHLQKKWFLPMCSIKVVVSGLTEETN